MNYEIEVRETVKIRQEWVEIVKMLSEGRRVGEIATDMEMNRRTLESEIAKIKRLCGCGTIGHLTAFFLRKGFIK